MRRNKQFLNQHRTRKRNKVRGQQRVQTHGAQVLCLRFLQSVTFFGGWRCVDAERRQQQQHHSLHNAHSAQVGKTNTPCSKLRPDSRAEGGRRLVYSGSGPSPAPRRPLASPSLTPRWPLASPSPVAQWPLTGPKCVCSAGY